MTCFYYYKLYKLLLNIILSLKQTKKFQYFYKKVKKKLSLS